ncbi:MAG: redoxin domain-containing protein [Bacteroidota bacterium]
MKVHYFLYILILLNSCSNRPNWKELELENLKGNKIVLSENEGPLVLFFLSPECPLCENYALNMREHFEDASLKSMAFYGIFPGEYYSKKQILKYKKVYDLKMEFLLDPDYSLTHSLSATVTPEVFLFNEKKELVYEGAIDNWMMSLGKKRTVITEHYLKDAFKAMKNNRIPDTTKTTPIGCYIE